MKHARLGTLDVSRIGLGTMGMSHAYTGASIDEGESGDGGPTRGFTILARTRSTSVRKRFWANQRLISTNCVSIARFSVTTPQHAGLPSTSVSPA
jgi:hypothetical protein